MVLFNLELIQATHQEHSEVHAFYLFDFLERGKKNSTAAGFEKPRIALAVVLLGLGEAHVHNKENSMTLEQFE